ncbi:MAG: sulfite exporter TauE/SafE family protein, partial [Paracoccaceae bacterium]|nr:sulfite exporter TauE/SafE family protein [Paracoccaceae bacterium]
SSERAFVAVVPFFLILAVLAIAMGNNLPRLVARLTPPGRMAGLTMVLMFIAGLYGGYFGAGLGFMLLAVLTMAGLPGLQSALAEKNLVAFLINTTAAVPLLASGLVSAPAAGAVILGGLAGGYLGARLARVVPDRPMRLAVALMGLVLTLSFLFR